MACDDAGMDLTYCTSDTLRDIIARERIYGRAFGVLAEACRAELAKRCERS